MLKSLKLTNVGPAPAMELELGPRLNLITGDNGLGKSFVLDVAWWALTGSWAGHPARPARETIAARRKATISFSYDGKERLRDFISEYAPSEEAWTRGVGRPANPGLVLYARVDGGFAVWDPARNRKRVNAGGEETHDRPLSYVFSPAQVWDGLRVGDKTHCNGLISDLVRWQLEAGRRAEIFSAALKAMSEGEDQVLRLGGQTRLRSDESVVYPTVQMGKGPEVPVVLASAAVRRVLALVYLLVWAWTEHEDASELQGQTPSRKVIFLIDEVECHLHPKWQRAVVPSLMAAVQAMARAREKRASEVQLLVATHSPLVLASVETTFDAERDAWFDLDQQPETGEVELQKRVFVPHGDVSNWLTSEAFNLAKARSLPAEKAMEEARALLRAPGSPNPQEVRRVDALLRAAALPGIDPFWVRWSKFAEDFGVVE